MEYRKYFTMSFDDGPQQDKKLIGLLKKYGLKGTFNLNSGLMGREKYALRMGNIGFAAVNDHNRFPATLFQGAPCHTVPADEITQVYRGFEVASHGKAHKILRYLGGEALRGEILEDIAALSDLTKGEITGHAYPFGLYNQVAMDCLRGAGIRYARTAKSTHAFAFPENPYMYHPTCACFDKRVFELLDGFMHAQPSQCDLLFCLWGHAYELDFETERNSWRRMENIMRTIAGRPDIVSCTNHEAFALHTA